MSGHWISNNFGLSANKKNEINGNCVNYNKTIEKLSPTSILIKQTNKNLMINNDNILEKSEPNETTDLAVHSGKIREVEFWLNENVISPSQAKKQFLLITGPTGCGKTSTLKVLCKKLQIQIVEWVAPDGENFRNRASYASDTHLSFLTQFLTRSKYPSLINNTNNKKVILVKDFPDLFIDNPIEFADVLEQCTDEKQMKFVFVCTEMSSSSLCLSQTLFPQNIKEKFNITHISFNLCADTFLRNALKRLQTLLTQQPELYQIPKQATVDAILSSSMGDIRCAINQYYFACLKGAGSLPVLKVNNEKKGRKRKRKEENNAVVKNMIRDERLGFFHSLGRVLNPKRVETNGSWRLQCDMKKLIDECNIQPTTFVSFLFENYNKYFGNLNDVCKAAEILSLGQLFLNQWNEEKDFLDVTMWVSVLGLMVCNEHRTSKWTQITKPVKVQNNSLHNLNNKRLDATEMFYHNFIQKTDDYHSFNVKKMQ